MLKIFKSIIKGNLDTETYARDTNHRVTMGYDAETQTIKVKVEKVLPPNPDLSEDLPEDTPTVLREPHTSADFVLIVEREFSATDFVFKNDNTKWLIEYDSKTKTISDPIDVYELAKQYINGSASHEKIYYNLNQYRYQVDPSLTPCFMLDCFYKSLGFDGSTVQFFVEDLQLDFLDTVLEVHDNQEITEVTPKEYEFWCQYNARVAVTFEVLDEQGKIVSSAIPTVKQEAKSPLFRTLQQKSPVDLTDVSDNLGIQPTGAANGNRFYVKLPATDIHNIRVLFGSRIHNLIGQRPFVTFDVSTVNGVSNKSRISNSYNPEEPNVYVQEFIQNHNHPAEKMNTVFSGVEGVIINTTGLISGDFFKFKLNLGEFVSWAELWVEIE